MAGVVCIFQFFEVGGLAYGLNRAIYKPFFQVVNLGAIFQKHSFVQSTNPPSPLQPTLCDYFSLGK